MLWEKESKEKREISIMLMLEEDGNICQINWYDHVEYDHKGL